MVKRFDLETDPDSHETDLIERSYGDYVYADDFDELMSKNTDLEGEVDRLKDIIKEALDSLKGV